MSSLKHFLLRVLITILFLAVPVLGVWTFVKAKDWGLWFPPVHSTFGGAIDKFVTPAVAAEVRERERHWQQLGINSVPAVIIDDRHLISGGQPPEVFERALRELAAVA